MTPRTANERQIRAAISAAEIASRRELECAALCRDPKNIQMRRANAAAQMKIAAEYRRALAEQQMEKCR